MEKKISEIKDEEYFIEEVKEAEKLTLHSLAFEFSTVVDEALHEFKQNPKVPRRLRQKKGTIFPPASP